MSGAHDVARDAALRLLELVHWDENMLDRPQTLDYYVEEIETIAGYLGVDLDKAPEPEVDL